MCGPADGDDEQEAREHQPHPGHQADLGLDFFVLDADGEVGPAEQDEEAEAAQQAADDGHGPGGLQVGGQLQHGLEPLTLLLAGTLHHTGHPQAFLIALHRERRRRTSDILYTFNLMQLYVTR